jgi:pimeloyl-ACP methyl ester carboxylesterase
LFLPPIRHHASKHFKDEGFADMIAQRSLHNQDYFYQAQNSFLIRDCYMDCFNAPVGINYFPMLSTIKVPVLLIGAKQDKTTPPLQQFLMSLYIRDVRKVILEDCGHLSNVEKSSEFNRLLKDFIDEI